MCRFAAYLGLPLRINYILTRPKDALIQQSKHANESEITVNGDGFGLAWYNQDISQDPAVFVSTMPAWNDLNLKRITHVIESPCFFAHIRAALENGVSLYNCHPFQFENMVMMHNGGVGGFSVIKQKLLALITEPFFQNIKGNTDSEVIFALWLSFYYNTKRTMEDMVRAWQQVLEVILALQNQHGIEKRTFINSVITDGKRMIGLRYSTNTDECLSMYYAAGQSFEPEDDDFKMHKSIDDQPQSIIVASEKLSGHQEDWNEMPKQHFIMVDEDKSVHLRPIS